LSCKSLIFFWTSLYNALYFSISKSSGSKITILKWRQWKSKASYWVSSFSSKMYSLKYGDVEQKRAKGIVKSVVRNELKHSHYVQCITDQKKRETSAKWEISVCAIAIYFQITGHHLRQILKYTIAPISYIYFNLI
jgi:hypothetical protein